MINLLYIKITFELIIIIINSFLIHELLFLPPQKTSAFLIIIQRLQY